MTGSLNGLRVLDLSRVLAGPVCTQLLGDLGAEILKVERPQVGDDTRFWGPPFLQDANGKNTTESAYYLSANRNKKSIAIDIASTGGQDLIHQLITKCDVLIENFKPVTLKKYGLDYEHLKTRHPHLIYCSISGFGQTGPLSSEPGYDFIAQGMGGFMAATGAIGSGPTKAGVAVTDYVTGMHAAIGILAALRAHDKTGKGQMVDCALLDSTIAMMTNLAQYYLTSGQTAPKVGNAHASIVPYQEFVTSDGHVIVAVGNDHQFKIFSTALGHAEWADEARFITNTARVAHRAELVALINNIMTKKSSDEWVEILRDVDIPVGPILKMEQVFAQDQVQARAMEIHMNHDLSPRPISLVAAPFKLSDTPADYKLPPPCLGADTDSVLRDVLGLSDENIMALRQKNIVA